MKVVNFWKPVKSNRKAKSISFINLSKFPKRSRTELKLIRKNPFGDRDKDKLMNFFDCKPLNKKKQGWAHRGHTFPRERTTHIKMMKPEKFLRTTRLENIKKLENEIISNPKARKTYLDELKKRKMKRGSVGDLLSPEEFKKIHLRKENIERLKKVIRSRKGKMEVPFLEYDEQGRPIGHEGRHRAKASQELGVKLMPVTIARRTLGKEERDWKSQRERVGAKKDWKMELEHEEEAVSSKSADIPIQEQREYGEEKPEVLAQELIDEENGDETAEDIVEELKEDEEDDY